MFHIATKFTPLRQSQRGEIEGFGSTGADWSKILSTDVPYRTGTMLRLLNANTSASVLRHISVILSAPSCLQMNATRQIVQLRALVYSMST